jgi:hypothetical protein
MILSCPTIPHRRLDQSRLPDLRLLSGQREILRRLRRLALCLPSL